MAAPTIAVHGSEELRRDHLRKIFTGEEVWCQLFSEPGAGSDLAGVATKAERVEDGWRVTGRKVWTSIGHLAHWGLLLTRSDPGAAKHRGLTYFVVKMDSPGIEIRPLYQITGEAEFNEVILDDVFVPDSQRLGEPGDGWRVALTTLMNERETLAAGAESHHDPLVDALALWSKSGLTDEVLRDRLTSVAIRSQLIGLMLRRAAEKGRRGEPGPEGSVGKLLWAEYLQQVADLNVDLLGDEAVLYPVGYPFTRPTTLGAVVDDPRWMYLRTRAATIEGGTSEVLRNVIAERVLGLPAEPRVDKDLPWKETRRG
jgi:alkylation response protein AidB-like acyl-CoA dehydrogenase